MKIRPAVPFGLFIFLLGGATYGQTPHPITSSGLNTQISTPVNLPGGAVQHNISGGTRPGGGGNLFHSFGEFGVPTNNIANFLNDAALPTTNILSRVTGGNPSNIFGTIRTEGFGNANLFLMNPAGIVFGPNASLNVGGAAHFTTADYLKLSDGVQFTALPSAQDALLSVAPIAAFGFLGTNRGGGISVDGSTLSVGDGQTISLVGGDIMIGGALNAQGGKIAIASVASAGEVLADTFASTPKVNGESFPTMGNIVLSEGAKLDVSNDAAGTVIIRGGELMMTNALISADTINENGALVGIDIDVPGDLSISTFDGPALTARTSGLGNAGEIKISSEGNMDINGTGIPFSLFSLIDTHTSGPGNGGNVTMTSGGDLTATGDPTGLSLVFFANTGTDGFDTGRGGDLSITAQNFKSEDITISTGNFFSFLNDGVGAGFAGDVSISAAEKINLFNSPIITDSFDFISNSGGNAGNVTLTAQEMNFNAGFISTAGWFQGGNVTITTDSLTLSNTSQITTQTRTEPGGAVTITGRVIELSGSNIVSTTNENADAGDITITATERLSLLNSNSGDSFSGVDQPSSIASNSFANDENGILGAPGSILIATPILVMDGGSKINTSSGSSGIGGNVLIHAQEITMSGQTINSDPGDLFDFGQFKPTGIFTASIGGSCAGPCGDAGGVDIKTNSIVLGKGAQINSSTSTDGRGGNINVSATDTIFISGTLDDGTSGGVLSRSIGTESGSGHGGNIRLTGGNSFYLKDGATVSASSDGPGNAGNINIIGHDTILIDRATVTTDAAKASGGEIKLTANDRIQLVDSTIESTVKGDATTVAGNIELDPDFIILQNSHILAKAVDGQGGNITIIASKGVLVDAQSSLVVTSERGISGTVNIESPIQVLSGTIVPLPSTPVNVATLYAARCVAGEGGHFSTFVDSKSDSVAPTPGTFLASPFLPQVSSSPAGALGHAGTPSGVSGNNQTPPIQLAAYSPPVLFAESDGMPSVCP